MDIDITCVRHREEFIYLAVIMDVFTSIIRGWRLSSGLGEELTPGALEQALDQGVLKIHQMDQADQADQDLRYAATDYTERLPQRLGADQHDRSRAIGAAAATPNEHPNDQGISPSLFRFS